MNQKDWEQLETSYEAMLYKLILPDDPTTNELKSLEAGIDELFTHARLDYAYCRRKRDATDRKFKAAHKVVMLAQVGKTVSDREALAVEYIQTNIIDNMPADLYTCLEIDEYRLAFMESVVDVLREKHERCITISGLLKIEAGL